MRKPVPKRRKKERVIHYERTGSHPRVRLRGAAKTERRREIFERSGGRCEDERLGPLYEFGKEASFTYRRCNASITWESMEWSHLRHGANKCDCSSPQCSIASCKECHARRHAGGNGKPVPAKSRPERIAI